MSETNQPIPNEEEKKQKKPRKRRRLFWSLGALAAIFALIFLVIELWMPVLQINSGSMNPTLQKGELVVAVKGGAFRAGDVVAFTHNNKVLVKRVICGSGEIFDMTLNGVVSVNAELIQEPYLNGRDFGVCNIDLPFQVPDAQLFVMGDNRTSSIDSRNTAVGCVTQEQVIGKVVLRIWPLNKMGLVH